jgi:hypothetical protein
MRFHTPNSCSYSSSFSPRFKSAIAFTGGNYGSSGFTCEQDEYSELVKQIKNSGIVKTNGSFLWSYKHTFKGKELVDWLISFKHVGKIFA